MAALELLERDQSIRVLRLRRRRTRHGRRQYGVRVVLRATLVGGIRSCGPRGEFDGGGLGCRGLCGGGLGGELLGGHQGRLEAALAGGQLLEVAHPGIGGHDDAGTQDLGPPAQVQVLPHGHDHRVVAPECVEQVGPDERRPAGCDEDIPDGIVLSVVDLVGLHPLDDGSTLVDAHADMDELHGVAPTHDFR